ncbi:Nif3-like dinuclear metal center hexameric protein [Desulforhopalus vacuolatus]|uniref:Nif3-like dinuclear metal center hexameric protein n=1 Tax=Desulforhopalus vacuolatus TaxID=40414 RepID=UPI001965F428|nr:Nif3-like dinuclear metal center hexameric protein [Desulforhopalus vacuolatus]MBM9520280.1 Nif3-like dinuclear metal center hexameric protein [Desulforhopalus vacuolatus]
MSLTAGKLLEIIDKITPFRLAESWDNVGMMTGSSTCEVRGVLTALDVSPPVLKEAVERGCNVILSHHPLIFHPLKQLLTDSAEGRMLQEILRGDIVVISSHTSFDNAADGVSDWLGECLGLVHRQPLLPGESADTGTGTVGNFASPITGHAFLSRLLEVINLPGVLVAGELPEQVQRVAICGGSGSGFAREAKDTGADLYLSAEIKHDTALWAAANRFCIIDGGHYPTEKPAMKLLAKHVSEALASLGENLQVVESAAEQNPLQYMEKL